MDVRIASCGMDEELGGLTIIIPAMNNAQYTNLLSHPHSAYVLAMRMTVQRRGAVGFSSSVGVDCLTHIQTRACQEGTNLKFTVFTRS